MKLAVISKSYFFLWMYQVLHEWNEFTSVSNRFTINQETSLVSRVNPEQVQQEGRQYIGPEVQNLTHTCQYQAPVVIMLHNYIEWIVMWQHLSK
jgi:hypothetical protein